MSTYLYNGVELPAPPEYDRTAYPYAFIARSHIGSYYFVASQTPAYFYLSGPDDPCIGWYTPSIRSHLRGTPKTWGAFSEDSVYTNIALQDDPFVWSNHDIFTADTNELFLAASEPVPVDPEALYRSKNTITLGSGKIYAVEYDGDALPSVEDVCVEANRLGYIKSGASLHYTEETAEEKDDLGLVTKTITTHAAAVLKCGLITWNLNTLRHLLGRYKVETDGNRRTLKIGGGGNSQGTKYVIVFHHEDKQDGDMWVMIVGRNTAGFTINYGMGAGSLIEPEFKAMPQPDGTLIQLIEQIATN